MHVLTVCTSRCAFINHFLSPPLDNSGSLRQWVLKQQLKRKAVNSTETWDVLLLKQTLYN